MKKEIIGKYYRLFTMKINGINYYFVGHLNEKGICFMSDKSEQVVMAFNLLERSHDIQKER